MTAVPAPIVATRALAAIAIAAFLIGGPLYRQVLGGDNPLFRPWAMYAGSGDDICVAQYYQRAPDGQDVLLDRYAVFRTTPEQAPRWLREMKSTESVVATARRLCARLGPDADVRVAARCGSRSGWKVVARRNVDQCVRP